MSVEKAKQTMELFDCDEVIVIARKYRETDSVTTISTYGKTKRACKQAAVVGHQFAKIIEAQPKSLAEAIEVIKN